LAGALALDVFVITLSSPTLNDDVLRNALNNAADRWLTGMMPNESGQQWERETVALSRLHCGCCYILSPVKLLRFQLSELAFANAKTCQVAIYFLVLHMLQL
jgi:hypothetical protein